MKILNKKNLLISSATIASLLFTLGTSVVQAATTNNNTNVFQVNHNNVSTPVKASISPVASHDNQTLRQVAEANNTSLNILENLNNNIDPDIPIQDGTLLYLPQNSIIFAQENSAVPHSLYVKYWSNLSPANRAAKEWIAVAIQQEMAMHMDAINC